MSEYGILVNLENENEVNYSLLEALDKYTHSNIRFNKLNFNKYSDEIVLEHWRNIIEKYI